MFRSLKFVLGGMLLAFLAACAQPVGFEVRSHPAADTSVSDFNQALYTEYWPYAVEQAGIDDTYASDLYARKGKAANTGATVLPEETDAVIGPGHNPVHESQITDLTAARERLMSFFDRGARDVRPVWAARAQVAYDCWFQEAKEYDARGNVLEPAAVLACRNNFETAMAKIEPFLPPFPEPMRMKMFELMPDQAPPPSPGVAGAPETYLVFFDWDKSNLTPEARAIVQTAATNAKRTGARNIEVTGYTDTSGPPGYNLGLSRRRAESVKAELVKQGISAASVTTVGKGETELLVPTPDGVREPQNRRARIVINIR